MKIFEILKEIFKPDPCKGCEGHYGNGCILNSKVLECRCGRETKPDWYNKI